MRTFRDAKAMAKSLRAEILARTQVDLSHSQCLEIVARQFGVDNWNIMAAKIGDTGSEAPTHWRTPFAPTTTIPVLRIFSVQTAKEFYLDFLGFTLDFGGPTMGEDPPFYGQVSRPGATLQLTEQRYEAGPGATVDIWITGLDDLRYELFEKADGVLGPAMGVPPVEEVWWGARVLVISDPFGNHLRLSEPKDPAAHAHLPSWANLPNRDAHA
jgi:catechol 2,3-dioxygenase-like lactoylglutathione lyase family enzyme